MNPLIQLTAFLVVATLSSSSIVKSPPTATKTDNFELLILHNNDMHARFEQTSQLSGTCTTADRDAGKCYGGFPRVATVVKEARKKALTGEGPPVLYLNAGDTYTGSAWFTIYKWKIAAEFINALQPDAVSLGNHEFDNGVSGLTPFIENLTSPVLAANLILTKVPELAAENNLKKSIILNVDGHKIGIIGYLTPDTKILAVKNDVEYIDEVVALQDEVTNLQSQGIKIIIALGHSGYARDLEIAKEVDGLDLVIGGHSNTFLWNGETPDTEAIQGPYPTYVTQSTGRQVPVVQAYAYTKYLGKLHITFDSDGEVVSVDGNPILLNSSFSQDPQIVDIVERYREGVTILSKQIVGSTRVSLDGLSCQDKECNMGNLITDAMIYKYAEKYKGKYWTDAAIAVIQGGGIRTSIAHPDFPAAVTEEDLLNVLPFQGSLVTVTLNGSTLIQMLEHAVANYSLIDFPGEFLQCSGLHVIYDLSKPPQSKVVSVKVRCAACSIPEYSDVNSAEFYNIIMPDFIFNGGDGYWMFNGLTANNLNYSELDATRYYINQTASAVFPEVEGRITLLNTDNINLGTKRTTSISNMLTPSIYLTFILLSGSVFKLL